MKVSIIAAMARNGAIGKDNTLMWHLPADLKHFREKTMGRPIIIGRKTYESLGKALPGRINIVVSRKRGYKAPGCLTAGSVEHAINLVRDHDEVFIAGGGEIYRQALPLADRMLITIIEHDFDGDTFFPEFDESDWEVVNEIRYEADEKNKYPMLFRTYIRK